MMCYLFRAIQVFATGPEAAYSMGLVCAGGGDAGQSDFSTLRKDQELVVFAAAGALTDPPILGRSHWLKFTLMR